MKRPIGLREGYQLLRMAECGVFTSAVMALIWVLRGAEIDWDEVDAEEQT